MGVYIAIDCDLFFEFMKNFIVCLAMWMSVNVGYSAFTDEVSSVTVPDSCATTGSGKSVFETIEEHLCFPMNSGDRARIKKALIYKNQEQQIQSVNLVVSLLNRRIRPYEFYQFLLLANHFKSDAEYQLTGAITGLEEICPTKVAENLELGFAELRGEETVVSWVESRRYLEHIDDDDIFYLQFLSQCEDGTLLKKKLQCESKR